MIDFQKMLQLHINILQGALKSEEELEFILKKRLTKKEFKVLCAKEQNLKDEDIAVFINSDAQRVQKVFLSAIKKINQEKIKQELTQVKG